MRERMTAAELRQFVSLIEEIEEEERRRESIAAYSLFGDDREMVERYRDKIEEIAGWINSIGDSITRRAFKLRYIDGLPWSAVSARMGYTSEGGARMICMRYLNQEEKQRV